MAGSLTYLDIAYKILKEEEKARIASLQGDCKASI